MDGLRAAREAAMKAANAKAREVCQEAEILDTANVAINKPTLLSAASLRKLADIIDEFRLEFYTAICMQSGMDQEAALTEAADVIAKADARGDAR